MHTGAYGHTENQIDHITINCQFRRSLLDIRVRCGADAATDHHLLVAIIKIKLRSFHDLSDRLHHKFNMQFLGDHRKQEEFNCEVKNRFAVVEGLLEETVANLWTGLQETGNTACTRILEKKEKQHKEWLTLKTWQKIEERKEQKINQCQDQQEKKKAQSKVLGDEPRNEECKRQQETEPCAPGRSNQAKQVCQGRA
ncbi:hypothetical protein C0Q70_11260 [Pomacea canaliculata]|uniref:Endonuclease/exonuclease/phosphatase domain-containing protein n=1 Tax=Pomacea canaliculata TaxID=400727 RepID=A0A2T7P5I1_POMCA|nr:hypothetical protein C0Q70_11260 [Pomacea canaliculata]